MGWDGWAPLFSKSPPAWLCTHPFSPVTVCSNDPLNWGYEPGFHPCSEHSLMCGCILPWGIYAVCRFAPETVRVNGRLSSNVYEVLSSHRVKSRTCDPKVLQCHCLCWQWLWQHRKTYLVALLQWVTHCRTVKEEATALCRTSKWCILCFGWVLKHSHAWSLMLVSRQLSKGQFLPLNDLLRLVFESHCKKKCQLKFAEENENKSVM